MASKDPPQPSVKDRLIEENLRRAFAEKANEDVPADLLNLLARLKQQEETDDCE